LHYQQPRLLAHADRVVVLSEGTGARMHELGLPADRTHVLGNCVDGFAEGSRADKGDYALAVGRLVDYKGFEIAIAAAHSASVPLVIAGDGPYGPRLRELAAGSDVQFVGWLDDGRLAELRAGAAVVLVPSLCEEACPYVALDAIAAGVPVLASDRGGIPERLPPGSVLPVGDGAAWAKALAELWHDPDRRRARGEESLALARELLSEDRYYDRLMQVYRE
jgi:glycosyltransferase involved in cell wall biosynthesis